jgi:hypothetical protein
MAKYLWLFFWLSPWFLVSAWWPNLLAVTNHLQFWQAAVLLPLTVLVVLLEFSILTALIGGAKGLCGGRVTRVAARVLAVGVSALVVATNVTAWFFFAAATSFPYGRQLADLVRTTDTHFLLQMTAGSGDRDLVLMAAFLVGVVSLILYRISQPITTSECRWSATYDCLIPGAFIVCGGTTLAIMSGAQVISIIKPIAQTAVAPQLAIWGFDLATLLVRANPVVTRKLELPRRAPMANPSSIPAVTVILLTIEALRADAIDRVVDGVAVTPTLTRLAHEGISFSAHFANSPETAYSHVALLTGLHPFQSLHRNLFDDRRLDGKTLYDILSASGFRTGHIQADWPTTARFFGRSAVDLVFDETAPNRPLLSPLLPPESEWIFDRSSHRPIHHFDKVRAGIARAYLSNSADPTFVALYLSSTHFPYQWFEDMGTPPFAVSPPPEDISFFSYSPERAALMRRNYDALTWFVDRQVGEFVDGLKRDGVWDKTVLIITGDHGESFHEQGVVTHGSSLSPEALQVPLILSGGWIRNVAPRSPLHYPTQHIDIAPTIVDMVGAGSLAGFQGVPLLRRHDAPSDVLRSEGLERRPIFLTAQSGLFLEGVVCPPHILAVERLSAKRHRYAVGDSRSRLIDSAPLEQLLSEFQMRQLSYYNDDRNDPAVYDPPALEDLRCPIAEDARSSGSGAP